MSITAVDHQVFTAGALAVISVSIPTSVTEGSSVNVQVTKGSYGCKQTEGLDISDLNQYATGFTTPVTNRPIEPCTASSGYRRGGQRSRRLRHRDPGRQSGRRRQRVRQRCAAGRYR